MRILISERFKPFSHVPGTSTILPGLGYQVEIYPCLIRIYDLKQSRPLLLVERDLDFKGPVEQFTVFNDLEKGRITVSGKTQEGWIRYHLVGSADLFGVRLFVERAPLGTSLHNKETIDLLETSGSFQPYVIPHTSRLFLGCHKAQDWEAMRRRLSLQEIFPHWHRLGQLIPQNISQRSDEGNLSLLETCRQDFINTKPEIGEKNWLKLILGGFNSGLVPQLEDSLYQGFVPSVSQKSLPISPLILLSEGARLINRLFVQDDENTLSILPYLLPCLPSGRLVDLSLKRGGFLSLEWTKKTIRRLMLYSNQEGECTLKFRSGVREFRLRTDLIDKGERRVCNAPIFFEKNRYYLFDNFL